MHISDLYSASFQIRETTMASLILFFISFSISYADIYINHFAVHIKGGHNIANKVARDAGLKNLGQIGSLDEYYLFEASNRKRRSASPSHEHHTLLKEHEDVHWFEQQIAKSRTKRDFHPRDVAEQMSVIDPYWRNQWYLNEGAVGGFDMNVQEAWRLGYTGKKIVATILDDGLERDHPDLSRNYDPFASYDVNSQDNDPMPRYDPSNENRHGTRCAGEISAEANNTHCTIGIAPDSRIGGIRMLDGEVYDAVEAASLSFNRSHVDIYSASWGPDDDGKVVDGPGKLAKKAFINGIENGRGGRGSIFVWASGNGGSAQDSCNCDGYANSIYTLSISSTSENGIKPWYLEECSSTLATTYSSGAYNERQIASTDLHYRCTTTHTGTSASAPLAAGIIALMLEANYDLTWRDVQYITLMTARSEPIKDGQWITNGVGRQVSLRYGYGLMDATAMVKLSLIWNTVPAKSECQIQTDVNHGILEAGAKFVSRVDTTSCQGESTEVNYLEHVQAVITLTSQRRGDVVIYLTSPMGTKSKLLPHRPSDSASGGFDEWPFLSVQFWGENPRGLWTLEIEDADTLGSASGGGILESWSLVFHGTKVQPVSLKNQTTAVSTPLQTTTAKTTVIHQSCHSECAGPCTGPSPKDCLECKNYRVGLTSTCVTDCPKEFYKDGKMCLPCEMSCSSCSGPTLTQCLSCPLGHSFQLSNNQRICSVECLAGFFLKNNSCLPCDSNCKECSNTDSSCTSCFSDFLIEQKKCVLDMSQRRTKKFALVAVLTILVVLVFIFLVVGLVYICKNCNICWWGDTKYGILPRDEEDVIEPFKDEPDDRYGVQ
uniref:P/Homo B domain-containing protein n=1 Tax=Arion vulgaris TaxID=1028688 RepID=A0A0B7BDJ9_9EUPU